MFGSKFVPFDVILLKQNKLKFCSLKLSFHTGYPCSKFITNTELIHQNVKYGYSAYPKRPNDPRVNSNPNFGVTLLNKQPAAVVSNDTEDFNLIKQKQKGRISNAMRIYLEKARQHNEFIQIQEEEFEKGRRHLANMMGLQLENITQEDIDDAIKYLLPSGIFDKRAHPRMKPPKEIYPNIKKAQFTPDGRPYHSFFYTGKANFYRTCFDLENHQNHLKEYEFKQIANGISSPPPESKIHFRLSRWMDFFEINNYFLEKIEQHRYDAFILLIERLSLHPYSKLCQDFLQQFRKEIKVAAEVAEIPPLKYDDVGRPYMNAVGTRKFCVAYVTIRGNGTGKVDINGKDILYFDNLKEREEVMTPLKFCGLLNKVDIECQTIHKEYTYEHSEDAPPFTSQVRELGTSAQSGAIRYGLSMALRSFLDLDTVEKMRSVGLLTPDKRIKERKKWGQEGARRKYTWRKR